MGLGTIAATAGIQLGSNILGGLFNSGVSLHNSKSLMRYQADLNQQMIDRANQYNLPKNQVSRLIQGGLNPNLAYQGISGSSASTSGSVGLGSAANPGVHFNIIDSLRNAQQLETDKAVTDLTRAKVYHQLLENDEKEKEQPYWSHNNWIKSLILDFTMNSKEATSFIDQLNADVNNMKYRAMIGAVDDDTHPAYGPTDIAVHDTPLYRATVDLMTREGIKNDQIASNIDYINKKIDEIDGHIKLMQKQGKQIDMKVELDSFERDLNKVGVSKKDDIYWRLLTILLDKIGIKL